MWQVLEDIQGIGVFGGCGVGGTRGFYGDVVFELGFDGWAGCQQVERKGWWVKQIEFGLEGVCCGVLRRISGVVWLSKGYIWW